MPPWPIILSLAMFSLGWHLAWRVRSYFANQDKRSQSSDFALISNQLRKTREELAAERSLKVEPGCGGPADTPPRTLPAWGTSDNSDPTQEYVEVTVIGGESFRIPLNSPKDSIAKVILRQNELIAVEHQRAQAYRRRLEELQRQRREAAELMGRRDKIGSVHGDYRFTDQWLRDEPDGTSTYRNTASTRSPRGIDYVSPVRYVNHGMLSPAAVNIDAMQHIIAWCQDHDRTLSSAPQQDVEGVWVFETRDLTADAMS